jgi:peptide/nickel transport system permease protein
LVLIVGALAAGPVEALLGVHHDVASLALRLCPPDGAHWLGCDGVGQDVFARLLFGARTSLAVGFGGALGATIVGASVGLLAAAAHGWVDRLLTTLIDALLALPTLPVLLLFSAATLGSPARAGGAPIGSAWHLVAFFSLFGWMGIARIARAEALRARREPYVTAAVALGASPWRIAVHHVLPMVWPAIGVAAALDVGRNILAEAALSYLGLGIALPTPSWGNMLRHAEAAWVDAPLLAFAPGACIAATIISVHVLTMRARAALDPRAGNAGGEAVDRDTR